MYLKQHCKNVVCPIAAQTENERYLIGLAPAGDPPVIRRPIEGERKFVTEFSLYLMEVILSPSASWPRLGAALIAAETGVVDLVGTLLLL